LEPNEFRCKIDPCDDSHSTFESVGGGSKFIFPLEEDEEDERDYCKHYPVKVNNLKSNSY